MLLNDKQIFLIPGDVTQHTMIPRNFKKMPRVAKNIPVAGPNPANCKNLSLASTLTPAAVESSWNNENKTCTSIRVGSRKRKLPLSLQNFDLSSTKPKKP